MGLTPDTELPPGRTSHHPFGLVTLTIAIAVIACGNETEPVDEWETIWDNTVAIVNEATAADPTSEQCQDLLGYLRVQRTILTPVPLDDLEIPVDTWFTEAEAMFFECDFDREGAEGSLLTLKAVESEVGAVLEVQR